MRGSDDMMKWLDLLGYSDTDLGHLNAIHIAGTNGKGSTCAFIASLLKAHSTKSDCQFKIGLYTSPHMETTCERIRINGDPITKELFAKRFFEIWDKLPGEASPGLDIPRYLQLLALLSIHVFIKANVNVAIYETHLGGEYDATNIFSTPRVTAITPISIDHSNLLGSSIQKIAWHKAGILKSGSPAFSAPQEEAAREILLQRASQKKVILEFVEVNHKLPVKPTVQQTNCSLAIAVVNAWLSTQNIVNHVLSSDAIIRGIEQFSWLGRFQQINIPGCQLFLDGAHNESSLTCAVEWFAKTAPALQKEDTSLVRVLIFSHRSSRDNKALLQRVAQSLRDNKIDIDYYIFTTYDERKDGISKIDRNFTNHFPTGAIQEDAQVWKQLNPSATTFCDESIEGALIRARGLGDENRTVQVLITGSLHLVSGALGLLKDTQIVQHNL
ncbi:folylpolyglutamate synthase [Bisporella sp. PMI_857]|nr:folylpolyglutamate synthase [Bisporella sp. PMI_857]